MKATVIVPTSIDRGPLLRYSVGSILRQTVEELEVFIVGDGAHDVTRDAALSLEKQDERVRFFDHPKGPSRGEVYRHRALQEARGEVVCYLCDRDLMLRDHVSVMLELLRDADFATTQCLAILEDQRVAVRQRMFDVGLPEDRGSIIAGEGVPLSTIAHTTTMYHRLPHGWTTTPAGLHTDRYMEQQFLSRADCRARSSFRPTILYFKRGDHPGLSTARRLEEIARWSDVLEDDEALSRVFIMACSEALGRVAAADRQRRLRRPLLLYGASPAEFCRRLLKRFANLSRMRRVP